LKAIVAEKPGGSEVLKIRDVPRLIPPPGWVSIRVMAFGLNRAEMFTRQGHSPGVKFPRILAIECVGVVEEAPGTRFRKGQQVAAIMGGMGRTIDGGYAEYTCVPASSVMLLESGLPWSTLGAIPEMFQTAWGSLYEGLEIQAGETLLICGGTSSIGMTATQIAKLHGLSVIATTRNPAKADALKRNGVDHVVIDTGVIVDSVRRLSRTGWTECLNSWAPPRC